MPVRCTTAAAPAALRLWLHCVLRAPRRFCAAGSSAASLSGASRKHGEPVNVHRTPRATISGSWRAGAMHDANGSRVPRLLCDWCPYLILRWGRRRWPSALRHRGSSSGAAARLTKRRQVRRIRQALLLGGGGCTPAAVGIQASRGGEVTRSYRQASEDTHQTVGHDAGRRDPELQAGVRGHPPDRWTQRMDRAVSWLAAAAAGGLHCGAFLFRGSGCTSGTAPRRAC